jgi:four helix bundle protein
MLIFRRINAQWFILEFMENKIRSFTELETWKEGHKFVLKIYSATNSFPQREAYSLTDQMRRSAISVTSNIAEGFSRRTKKDKSQFYFMALGSTTELQNQLVIARDLGYMSQKEFQIIGDQSIRVSKLIRGLLKTASTY